MSLAGLAGLPLPGSYRRPNDESKDFQLQCAQRMIGIDDAFDGEGKDGGLRCELLRRHRKISMFLGIIAGLLRFIRRPKQEKGAGLFGYFEDFMVFKGRLFIVPPASRWQAAGTAAV